MVNAHFQNLYLIQVDRIRLYFLRNLSKARNLNQLHDLCYNVDVCFPELSVCSDENTDAVDGNESVENYFELLSHEEALTISPPI